MLLNDVLAEFERVYFVSSVLNLRLDLCQPELAGILLNGALALIDCRTVVGTGSGTSRHASLS